MAAQPTGLGAGVRLFRRRRHLKRYRQIISVLTRNGFGLLLEQLGVYGYLRMRRRAAEERARECCERLLANPVIHRYEIEVA